MTSVPEDIGEQPPFRDSDAEQASFFEPVPGVPRTAAIPEAETSRAYRNARQDTGSESEKLVRASRAFCIMLGIPAGAPAFPEVAINQARWRDKYVVAAVMREAAPGLALPRQLRRDAFISRLMFKYRAVRWLFPL